MGDGYYWLRNTDSNRDKQIQRLSCYPYTIPQCDAFATDNILTHISDLSIAFPEISELFIKFQRNLPPARAGGYFFALSFRWRSSDSIGVDCTAGVKNRTSCKCQLTGAKLCAYCSKERVRFGTRGISMKSPVCFCKIIGIRKKILV